MDFVQRLHEMKPKKYEEVRNRAAAYGRPAEVFEYMDRMPILCPEDGIGCEVRIDKRFLVVASGIHLFFISTRKIESFCVAAEKTGSIQNKRYYEFCVFNFSRFCVSARYASDLYSSLRKLCPEHFSPLAASEQSDCYHYVKDHMTSDGENITLSTRPLFGKKQTIIPQTDIIACYQTYCYDSEGSDTHYLHLYMRDGSEHKIFVEDTARGFVIARWLKSVIPNLFYQFPV